MFKNKTLVQLQSSMTDAQSCIVNLTAKWCSDCTDQSHHLHAFSEAFSTKSIDVYSVVMQEEKNIYLSAEHQQFTESVGGHGFPRTVLFVNGTIVDADNVEIITTEQLGALAKAFLAQL